jgi:hypothetical protein
MLTETQKIQRRIDDLNAKARAQVDLIRDDCSAAELKRIEELHDKTLSEISEAKAELEIARAGGLAEHEKMARNEMQINTNFGGFEPHDAEMDAIVEGQMARAGLVKNPSERARQYAGMTLVDLARDRCDRFGFSTRGMNANEAVTRAVRGNGVYTRDGGGYMTSSDFPNVLANLMNKSARVGYDAPASSILTLGKATTAADFRAKYRVQLSGFGDDFMERVNEHGEFKRGSMVDAKESYVVETFGKIIPISRQAVVNDSLSMFTSLPLKLGQAARAFEAQKGADLLQSNSGAGPVMSDTYNLFDGTHHGNDAGSGAAPSLTSLDEARKAMRTQTGLASELIAVNPSWVLCGPTQETKAQQMVASIQATKTADVNPLSVLQVVVDARITGNAWYVVADNVDGLEYAHLERGGLYTETRIGFDIDGIEVKIRDDFGIGFVDHRGWFRNSGSAPSFS